MSFFPQIEILRRAQSIFLMGVLFFLYSWAAGVTIQTILVPTIFPNSNFGEGLVVPDSIGFNQIAKSKAAEILEKGWRTWEIRPQNASPAGIASIFYALWIPKPYSLLPFNALVHALSGCIVLWILRDFFAWKPSIFGSALFIVNPAAMEWVAQIHRDGLFILGNLMVLACLGMFGKGLEASKGRFLGWGLVVGIAGSCLVWVARPHWVQVLFVIVLLCVLLSAACCLHMQKKQSVHHRNVFLVVVGLLLFLLWLGKHSAYPLAELSTPATVTPATVTPATVTPATVTPATVTPATVTPVERDELWHHTAWLPEVLEKRFLTIAILRRNAILTGGNTVVDVDVHLNSVKAFVAYVPRALQLGLLSPLPELWRGEGSSPAMTMARKIMGIVTVFCYLCLAGLAVCIIRFRRRLEFSVTLLFCLLGITVYVFLYPNIGSLMRYRYGFYMVLISFGAAAIADIFLNNKIHFMNSIITKIFNSFRTEGLIRTTFRILRFPFVWLKSFRNRKAIFSSASTAERFSKIYEVNWWGSKESVSGSGSTLLYTENLRKELPLLFRKFGMHSVYDAPCGDFNWMKRVVDATDISYIGGDIVPQLIEKKCAQFSGDRVNFILANIITDRFPKADLWICRDCFIHFSFRDIYLALSNFVEADIPFLLTTTHINTSGFKNLDIRTGDARMIDLFSAPFFLPKECEYRIEDWLKPDPPREMVLFHKDQIVQALPKMQSALGL